MGLEGLAILDKVRRRTGIGIVTELMDTDNADAVAQAATSSRSARATCRISACSSGCAGEQAGAAQARHVGDARGVVMAAEYVMAGGNYNVILCERGVRTFSDHSATRSTCR